MTHHDNTIPAVNESAPAPEPAAGAGHGPILLTGRELETVAAAATRPTQQKLAALLGQ